MKELLMAMRIQLIQLELSEKVLMDIWQELGKQEIQADILVDELYNLSWVIKGIRKELENLEVGHE